MTKFLFKTKSTYKQPASHGKWTEKCNQIMKVNEF